MVPIQIHFLGIMFSCHLLSAKEVSGFGSFVPIEILVNIVPSTLEQFDCSWDLAGDIASSAEDWQGNNTNHNGAPEWQIEHWQADRAGGLAEIEKTTWKVYFHQPFMLHAIFAYVSFTAMGLLNAIIGIVFDGMNAPVKQAAETDTARKRVRSNSRGYSPCFE